MVRGWKDKLEKYVDLNENIFVDMKIRGNAEYDFCCFGVDSEGKLSDDRYMVFYNQKTTPQKEVSITELPDGVRYTLKLSAIPDYINKLVFTVSIDGTQTMGEMECFITKVYQQEAQSLELSLTGGDFAKEKAVIAIEIYRKDVWRIGCVAGGFDGGLSALLAHFGGEEVGEGTATVSQADTAANMPLSQGTSEKVSLPQATSEKPAPSMDTVARSSSPQATDQKEISSPTAAVKVSLEKKLEKAPKLVSLAKPLGVELKKRNLETLVARVGLVMDISGSMTARFKNGTVQEIVNKTLPLAVQFDDDGELDCWYYGTTARRMDSVNLDNYTKAVPKEWKQLMLELGGCNNEPVVLRMVLDTYRDTQLPVYVLFITDGGVSKKSEIQKIITEASKLPIFWQFVGVGGSGYGILEKLDNMKGRYVDNAGFFALDDFKKVSNEELYARLLEEFPKWLKAIRDKGMI
jgi:stress protein